MHATIRFGFSVAFMMVKAVSLSQSGSPMNVDIYIRSFIYIYTFIFFQM